MNALRRTIGSAVVALAVALVVVGSTVGSAAATTRDPVRDEAVAKANAQIDYCFQTGGDVEVFTDSTGDSITVICSYPSGRTEVCTYNPVTKCWEVKGISAELTAPIPVDSLPVLATLDPSGGPAQPTAGPTTPDDQAHATSKAGKKHRHGGKRRKK